MTEPGWYNDELDADLARWHDGSGWTSHTIVKADWRGPGAPPPPLQPAFAPAPEPTTWMPSAHAAPPPYELDGVGTSRTGMVDRYRTMPMWARVAGPAVAAVIVLGAVSENGGSNNDDPSGPVATIVVPIDGAIDIVRSQIDTSATDAQLRRLINDICAGDVDGSAESALAVTREPTELRQLIDAAGDGAEAYCPDDVRREPALLNDVYAAAVADDAESSSTTVAASVITTAPMTTTAPRATVTTRAPAPFVSPTSPPATQPPVTTAPTGAAPGVYYANCTAARDAGAAPVYRGDPGYAPHLDRDDDGIGCE